MLRCGAASRIDAGRRSKVVAWSGCTVLPATRSSPDGEVSQAAGVHTSPTLLRTRVLTGAAVHQQHDSKARPSGHHLRVGGRRFLERDGLDHRGHARQQAEPERRIPDRRSPGQGAFQPAIAEDESRARYLDRFGPDTEIDRCTTRTKAREGRRDRFVELRNGLEPDDRTLLALGVDRRMR